MKHPCNNNNNNNNNCYNKLLLLLFAAVAVVVTRTRCQHWTLSHWAPHVRLVDGWQNIRKTSRSRTIPIQRKDHLWLACQQQSTPQLHCVFHNYHPLQEQHRRRTGIRNSFRIRPAKYTFITLSGQQDHNDDDGIRSNVDTRMEFRSLLDGWNSTMQTIPMWPNQNHHPNHKKNRTTCLTLQDTMRTMIQKLHYLSNTTTTATTTTTSRHLPPPPLPGDHPTSTPLFRTNTTSPVTTNSGTITSSSSSTTTTSGSLQMALVRLGMIWDTTNEPFQPNATGIRIQDRFGASDDIPILSSNLVRVPGCISTVHVQTILEYGTVLDEPNDELPMDTTSTNTEMVWRKRRMIIHSIRGTADAHVSRGLLACIAELLQHVSVQEILALSSTGTTTSCTTNNINTNNNNSSITIPDILQQLSFHTILSPGRNDGFTNIIATIQRQINDCMDYGIVEHADSHTPAVMMVQPQHDHVDPKLSESSVATTTADTRSSSSSSDDDDVEDTTTNTTTTIKRVALLLSGGVDSSVALHVLVRNHLPPTVDHHNHHIRSTTELPPQQQQYQVTAFYLKIWLEDELLHFDQCPWEEDYRYCQAVCEQLNVPLETLSLQEEYKDYILAYTINEARNGRTPNPDILCNRRIKFGCFYQAIAERNFDYIATGHYAQIVRHIPDNHNDNNLVQLHRAPDMVKDQSYFLCALTQEQLQRVLFPIGHFTKTEVRQLAETYQLPNRYRPDSQGLCFLGKIKFDTFLHNYISDRPGPILDASTGEVLGQHRGLWYHTIGQRKGLGKVLLPSISSKGPWYVVGKDTSRNIVYCTNQYDDTQFTSARSEFAVESIHWIAGCVPPVSLCIPDNDEDDMNHNMHGTSSNEVVLQFAMKIRHGPKLVHGTLTLSTNGHDTDNDRNTITTGYIQLQNVKDSGLAPGQYVVFYDPRDSNNNTECFGCAVISERNWGVVVGQEQQQQLQPQEQGETFPALHPPQSQYSD
jgi:tRNA-5-taurinomethyluridine 2-sulfurtransferase